ncbi:MAG: FAD-dependent oxidoreductase [Roseinatronobacter sp.]|nr:MAG: FAD-dependent oxidoreductase [Roseinatronobacter sp.]
MELKPDFGTPDRLGDIGSRIVVIGGGASGVLMALHLLRRNSTARIILIEKSDLLGCGVAYGTRDPAHLLNTRVSSMSAYADDPDHFLTWLRTAVDPAACPFSFVSRTIYGRYLAETLSQADGCERLSCLRGEAIRLSLTGGGVLVRLADGRVLAADHVVLATGHALPETDPDSAISLPWGNDALPAPDAGVLLVGTGLTMVDQVLTLLDAGHRGRIEAVSRRGLLPKPHADAAASVIASDDLPLGQPVSIAMRWLRDRVADTEAQGGDWRSVVDGLRPHVQRLWQVLDMHDRARFLRHACTWWEVHRHRLPPCSAERLAVARAEGRLILSRAAFRGADRKPDGSIAVRLRPTNCATEDIRTFQHVVDCRGIRRDPARHAAPVIRQMIAERLAYVDPLGLGIVVDRRARVLRPDGSTLPRLTAIGPVSRSAFWEITAIPDIRQQAAWLSETLVKPECDSK